MSDIRSLADDYIAYRRSTDHLRWLWKGEMEWLEEWEDLSSEGIDNRMARLTAYAVAAEEITRSHPSATADTIVASARAAATQIAWGVEWELPNPTIGLYSLLLTFLPRYVLRTSEDGDRYLDKLHRLPTMLGQLEDRLRWAAAIGRTPITSHVRSSIDHIGAGLDLGDRHPLCDQSPPIEVDDQARVAWSERLRQVVGDEVLPALDRYRQTLADVTLPAARPDEAPGLVHVDGGAEAYRDLIESHTTVEKTAEEIHHIGLDQVGRLEDEYRTLAGPILDSDDISEIYRKLRDDPTLRYQDGASLVADAETALARATEMVPDWFGSLPTTPCVAAETAQGDSPSTQNRPRTDRSRERSSSTRPTRPPGRSINWRP